MQLGMIGLGRMGANMVRRLLRNRHTCVVYDRNPGAVTELASEGAQGAASLAEFVAEAQSASSHLVDGPGGGRGCEHRRSAAAARARTTS